MTLSSFRNRLRRVVATRYGWIILIAILLSLAYAIDLVLKGMNYYTVLVAFLVVISFLLMQHPRYSYFGAMMMAVSSMYLITLSLISIIFSDVVFFHQTLISAGLSLSSILPLHFITKEKRIMMPMFESIFFGALAYVVTTLLLTTAFGGLDIEANLLVLSISIGFIILSLLIVVNRSYREKKILGLIDISNLNLYYDLHEDLQEVFFKYKKQTERVMSEFKSSITSFIAGDFNRSIEAAYRCLEGLDRLLEWSKYPSLESSKFQEAFKEIRKWRNKISHSDVSRREKDKKRRHEEPITHNEAITAIKHTYDILCSVSDIVSNLATIKPEK